MTRTIHAVHQVSRPQGAPTAENFAFVTEELAPLAEGTALVENLYFSVDPYMRQAMDEGPVAEGHWALDAPLEGRSLGRVIESRTPALAVGEIVGHRKAWRTHAVVTPDETRRIPDLAGVPLSAHLSAFGGTGLTAWVGLTRIARLQPGESIFVSAAAGGVGSAAGQLAKLIGAGRVIGSAGSPAKVKLATERLGYDVAFDYHDGPVMEQLRAAAPDGLDAYLDNVGGDHLEAAIERLRENGRIAWSGAIAQYNSTEAPAAPRNLFEVNLKALRMEGFLVRQHMDALPELYEFLAPHLASGRVVPEETVVEGFDRSVEAFLGLFRGENTGKMLVKVAD
ncbi:NADP-dependent oxidoreductase [Kitasatospora acidiphila]|uniref:NADP-dependent oxidoreductase n=1 Tax=Kitasatospora acidiphila TaxID=2567942 RepID=A0A540WC67_9ACTN|nr:NADP-dependent oxidoreductase [Kitasatospora acidiphila]TQF06606.1 NADP-dependent oxidoreductase [Kitasatospora acidiphila]